MGVTLLSFFGNRRHRYPQDETLVQNSLGSGVIVTNEGHIITNTHVVSDGEGNQVDQIEVQLSDGRTRKARLIGADSQMDLAVLKIDNPGVKPLKLADSDTVQPGDFVVAIGNPFGLQETVTDGIISWKGQPNSTDFRGDLLQTNAAINPGNSGGPLINLRGKLSVSTNKSFPAVGFTRNRLCDSLQHSSCVHRKRVEERSCNSRLFGNRQSRAAISAKVRLTTKE